MARMKTVTLKLNRADHDLLIPNIDKAIGLLKLLPTKEEREKRQREWAKKREKEQGERRVELTKEALKSLTKKEKDWLRTCNKDAFRFECFKNQVFSLKKDLACNLSLSKSIQHLLDEWLAWEYDLPLPVKPLIDELVTRIDNRRDEWDEFLESEWGTDDEPGERENNN